MKSRTPILCIAVMLAAFSSCVPAKKFQAEQQLNSNLTAENNDLKKQLSDATSQSASLADQINELNGVLNDLMHDTADLGGRLRKMAADYADANNLYEQQVQQNRMLLSKSSSEKRALLDSLTKKQNDISRKEHALDSLQSSLAMRESKLNELQSLLNKKDSATAALKAKIQQALLGFEKSDLTVEEKNGKVYVSLAEKLLFPSGSTEVNPKGKSALQKVAEVLKKNPDISITVEGHTDNVPISTPVMKDNWDLSVLRATSIIRILTHEGVDPKQITASGRGEYFPVATNATTDGKARNRRTEIILTPNYAELAKILGDN